MQALASSIAAWTQGVCTQPGGKDFWLIVQQWSSIMQEFSIYTYPEKLTSLGVLYVQAPPQCATQYSFMRTQIIRRMHRGGMNIKDIRVRLVERIPSAWQLCMTRKGREVEKVQPPAWAYKILSQDIDPKLYQVLLQWSCSYDPHRP